MEPLTLDEFADRTDTPREEIERFRDAGLLDLEGKGSFDAADVVRLNFLRQYEGFGGTVDDVRAYITGAGLDHLFSAQRTYSLDEAVGITGLDAEQLITLGAALGISQDGRVTEDDVQSIEIAKRMMDAGFSWDGIVEGARVYADSLRRIAEANLQMTHRYLCAPLLRAGKSESEIAAAVQSAILAIAPNAEAMMQHLYHRYMAEASIDHAQAHLEPLAPDAPLGSQVATIVFVDLSLFSSFTYLEGDEAAVDVVDRFDRAVRGACVAHRGRVVKQIGDEFMLIFRDPADAVRFAIELRHGMGHADESVQLRTGIHHGSVLYRLGDYWGNAVNVAARIVSMAMPNSILVTEPVAKAAIGAGMQAEEIGVRSLRGMEEPLSLYRVSGAAL
jgi:adenylate cyclase